MSWLKYLKKMAGLSIDTEKNTTFIGIVTNQTRYLFQHPSQDVPKGTERSILKQAGLK